MKLLNHIFNKMKNIKNKFEVIFCALLFILASVLLLKIIYYPSVLDKEHYSAKPIVKNMHNNENIEIIYPRNNSIVETDKKDGSLSVAILTKSFLNNDIWIIIYPHLTSNKGWPLLVAKAENVDINQNWSLECKIGSISDTFDIVVYSATKEASRYLTDFTDTCSKDNFYPGLLKKDIPKGLEEQSRVTFFYKVK